MQPPLVYADTSVYGGVFDAEFRTASREFFGTVANGRYKLCVSPVVQRELEPAPQHVRELHETYAVDAIVLPEGKSAALLAAAYLSAGLLPRRMRDDAMHLAISTVGGCDYMVSWNYKHLVGKDRRQLFSAVSILEGDHPVELCTPLDLLGEEPSNGKRD